MINMETLREVMKYMNFSSASKFMDSSISDEAKAYSLGIMRATEFLLECTENKSKEISE